MNLLIWECAIPGKKGVSRPSERSAGAFIAHRLHLSSQRTITTNCALPLSLQTTDRLGRWSVQTEDVLQGRLPVDTAEMQVRAAAVPPERLPERHGLPFAARRWERLAPGDHDQTDSARHPGSTERAKREGSGTSGGVHDLLVSLEVIRSTGELCVIRLRAKFEL